MYDLQNNSFCNEMEAMNQQLKIRLRKSFTIIFIVRNIKCNLNMRKKVSVMCFSPIGVSSIPSLLQSKCLIFHFFSLLSSFETQIFNKILAPSRKENQKLVKISFGGLPAGAVGKIELLSRVSIHRGTLLPLKTFENLAFVQKFVVPER